MRIAVVLGAVSAAFACGCTGYTPGSFASFPGQRTTIGCLDVAVQRRADLADHAAVLAYHFGNRCRAPAVVDLAHVRVVDDHGRALAPYDPRAELVPLTLDGRLTGREAIAYPSTGEPIAYVCVDVASLARTAPEQWLCL